MAAALPAPSSREEVRREPSPAPGGGGRGAHARSVRGRGASAGGDRELRGAAGARPLMPKRRAEPLMCHVPVKRLLRVPPLPRAAERRPRSEPARAGPAAPKRPLEEAEAPPGKRPGPSAARAPPGDGEGGWRRRGEPAVPQDERAAEGCAGGRGKERTSAAAEQEEFCLYNSFLYWRAPLPTIDLSDIQNLVGETPSNTRTPSKTDTTETEMET
ncbi:uncharacterized protein C9orf40 homolog [Pseudopipra pipra]|uniref:uncharacterized protein C9orf40 homolog n=1 Tax=Pseudopipra pipra TaxID=415032 RepID=UPI00313A3E6C